jgi:hypothetical protein
MLLATPSAKQRGLPVAAARPLVPAVPEVEPRDDARSVRAETRAVQGAARVPSVGALRRQQQQQRRFLRPVRAHRRCSAAPWEAPRHRRPPPRRERRPPDPRRPPRRERRPPGPRRPPPRRERRPSGPRRPPRRERRPSGPRRPPPRRERRPSGHNHGASRSRSPIRRLLTSTGSVGQPTGAPGGPPRAGAAAPRLPAGPPGGAVARASSPPAPGGLARARGFLRRRTRARFQCTPRARAKAPRARGS